MALEIGRSHSVGPQGVVADQVVNPADGSRLIRTLADLKSEIARLRINSSSETENPKCPKVPKSLLPSAARVSELSDDHHYEPVVMSFGPYHHGNPKLVRGEKIKLLLAVDFFDVLGLLLPRRNDDQPLEQRVDMPLDQPVDQPVDKPVDQPVDQPLDQPVHQPVDQSVDQPVDQPLGQPVDHPLDDITEKVVDQLYDIIWGIVCELEGYYDGELMERYSGEQFSVMMLVDGCALLWYILCVCSGGDHEDYNIRYQDLSLIHQDALLLENQLPYQLLQALMKITESKLAIDGWTVIFLEFFGMIEESFFQEFFDIKEISFLRKMKNYCCRPLLWITQICNPKSKNPDKLSNPCHHLLDLYRRNFLGPTPKHTENGNSGNENDKKDRALVGDVKEQVMASFRNVKELMAAGIRIKPSPTRYLREISFTSNCVTACLRLPPITIDKSTKTLFFNLIAYEMTLDVKHHDFISYLRFLDSLIDHADDVKELQSAGVLQNNLGTHEEVAEFFNTVSADLESHFLAYKDVRVKIRKHLKNYYNSRLKMWMTQCLDTYFGSPWTIIAWVGAALALFFTAVQTYFSVFPH